MYMGVCPSAPMQLIGKQKAQRIRWAFPQSGLMNLMRHAATRLASLGNMFHGRDLKSLTSSGARSGSSRTLGSCARSRRTCDLYFVTHVITQFCSVASELIGRSVFVGEREIPVGSTQAAFHRHLAAGPGAGRCARVALGGAS